MDDNTPPIFPFTKPTLSTFLLHIVNKKNIIYNYNNSSNKGDRYEDRRT